MSKSEEKLLRNWLPKQKNEQVEPSIFAKEWFLDWWLPKLIYILGIFAIVWKLFDIFILRRFL